jgi:actin-like ATPase involved in cell morphogenesis
MAPEPGATMEDTPRLDDTALQAWAASRDGHGALPRPPGSADRPEPEGDAPSAPDGEPAAASVPAPSAETGEAGPGEGRNGTTGPHPPLDDAALPELVVTEFKGPGPLRRPAGLEQTRASADVHAAITPAAGTLIATPLDEPPPEPPEQFKLDAPVRGDEPLHVPESSFHDVAEALKQPGPAQDRPTTPIPLLPSMETAAPDEMPIPPPPPLDEAPVLEEGAVRLEAEPEVPRTESKAEPPAPAPLTLAPPPVEAREQESPAQAERTDAPAGAAGTGAAPVGTTELGIEINAESIRASWFHDGRARPLVLDAVGGRHEIPVRLVREPGAPPRMLPPEAPEVALWVGAPLPFLGTPASADTARTVARRWPAALVPDDRGEAAFMLEGGTVGAGELVATLLRWVRHRAEELTSHQAGRVVLTVPVAFNTVQRERLREAAERAGFEGVRLVQAPTAATMAFAHGRGLARRRILVFRMGASTCDIAVLAASGNDLDMVACGGDASLGSANFDEQIALALDKAARADGAVLRRRIGEAAQLRTQLEDATVKEGIIDGSRLLRTELEARTTALVERGVLLAREVLRSASLTPESLDELVVVGAATRLPHVKRMIEDAMGRYARTDVDAGSAVSIGAAALAHLLNTNGKKTASRTALHEVLGVPLEIIAPELGQVRVLDRNTRLPAEKTLTMTLALGAPLEVQVFQGTAKAPDPRSFLGLLRAPADRAGDWLLHLSLDTDGVLRADATNPSGKRQPLQLQMPAPSPEAETPPPQRVPSEPEAPAVALKPETGVLGGLKKLFGRR